MPFPLLIPLITAGIAAAGGALGGRKSARTTTSTGNNSFSNTTTNTPTDNPQFAAFRDLLLSRATNRLNQSVPLAGYEAQGIGNINNVSRVLAGNRENALTARGLAGSPIAAQADLQGDLARGGQIAQFQNTLPLVQRQAEGEDLDFARMLYGMSPRSTTTTNSGTGQQSSTGVAPGSPLQGGISSLADMLAYLAGKGLLGGKE